jgi:hypothetical protein
MCAQSDSNKRSSSKAVRHGYRPLTEGYRPDGQAGYTPSGKSTTGPQGGIPKPPKGGTGQSPGLKKPTK